MVENIIPNEFWNIRQQVVQIRSLQLHSYRVQVKSIHVLEFFAPDLYIIENFFKNRWSERIDIEWYRSCFVVENQRRRIPRLGFDLKSQNPHMPGSLRFLCRQFLLEHLVSEFRFNRDSTLLPYFLTWTTMLILGPPWRKLSQNESLHFFSPVWS